MKKKMIAAAFVLLGVGGLVATAVPANALDIGPVHLKILPSSVPCLRVDVVIGGNDIGPLERPLCV